MNIINFTPFPELSTERCKLRQLNDCDSTIIYQIRSDKNIAKYLNRPIANSVDDAETFIKKTNEGIARNQLIYWGVSLKENSQIIGTITLWQISRDGKKVEIGFELLPKHQGNGIMREAMAEVIRFAFEEIEFTLIVGEVDSNNIKSIKLMKRFGFKLNHSLEKTDVYQLRVCQGIT